VDAADAIHAAPVSALGTAKPLDLFNVLDLSKVLHVLGKVGSSRVEGPLADRGAAFGKTHIVRGGDVQTAFNVLFLQ
jgi:hypothetical protein